MNNILDAHLTKVPTNSKTNSCSICFGSLGEKAWKGHESSIAPSKKGWKGVRSPVWYCEKCHRDAVVKRDDFMLASSIEAVAAMLSTDKPIDVKAIDPERMERIKQVFYSFRNAAWG